MKKLFLIPLLCLGIASCGGNGKSAKPENDKVSEIRFPPPVVKGDNEVMANEAPVVEELKAADPARRLKEIMIK